MNWTRYLLAVVLSGFATTFTDWLFMGVLSGLLFFFFCVWAGIILSHRTTLHTSLLVWVAAAVPIIFSNIVWIKMDPLLGVSHSLGWLARFVVTGMIGNWLLH